MQDVKLPICSIDRKRPMFVSGDTAAQIADAYEQLKGKLLSAESCIEAMIDAVDRHKETCEEKIYE